MNFLTSTKSQLPLTVLIIFFTGILYAQPPISKEEINGRWVNQNGSILEISSINKVGGIKGTFKSFSGAGEKSFDLVGTINYQESTKSRHQVIPVSFLVNWGGYGSITSFAGFIELRDDQPVLYTQWNLVRTGADSNWQHMLTGSDVFQKGN